jgi:hypothetical protein
LFLRQAVSEFETGHLSLVFQPKREVWVQNELGLPPFHVILLSVLNQTPLLRMKKATSITQVSATGATHSFSQEEKEAFCDHINEVLKNDPHLAKILPVSSEGNALFDACKDGKLLWYFFSPSPHSRVHSFATKTVNDLIFEDISLVLLRTLIFFALPYVVN